MPAPGRNDPCPCGSGRKFKHCCLGKADAEGAARLRLRRAEGRLVGEVFGWAAGRFGEPFFDAAVMDFHLGEPPGDDDRDQTEFEQEAIADEAGVVTGATFSWVKAGNKQQKSWTNTTLGSLRLDPGRLTADVNSAERADRLIREVTQRLGGGATLVSRAVEDVEARMAEIAETRRPGASRPADRSGDEPRPPELDAMEATLRRQYAIEWLDTEVPALGNATPRAAVRTTGGRERVEALLASFERRAADAGQPDDETFRTMRRELGLQPR